MMPHRLRLLSLLDAVAAAARPRPKAAAMALGLLHPSHRLLLGGQTAQLSCSGLLLRRRGAAHDDPVAVAAAWPMTAVCQPRRGMAGSSGGESSWDTSVRLHGTVTGFKHRRGYGFLVAEGYTKRSLALLQEREAEQRSSKARQKDDVKEGAAPAGGEEGEAAAATASSPVGNDFFFTRAALGGGFYVREGERVSFRVRRQDATPPSRRPTHRYVSCGYVAAGDTAQADEPLLPTDEGAGSRRQGPHQFSAIGVRLYDVETGAESRVLPVAISGVVTRWDAVSGSGVISELDVEGKLHPDAPQFAVALEDVDLSPVVDAPESTISEGRYVKFCLSAQDEDGAAANQGLPRASKVIIDIGTERRIGKISPRPSPASPGRRRSGFGAGAPGGSSAASTVLPDQRGVVREVVERKYAFVVDDATGESIFFHLSEMAEPPTSASEVPQAGDGVMYDLETLHSGRHAGKKHCVRVRRLTSHSTAAEDTEADVPPAPPAAARGRGSKRGKSKMTETQKSLLDEFDLLD